MKVSLFYLPSINALIPYAKLMKSIELFQRKVLPRVANLNVDAPLPGAGAARI